MFVFMSMWHTRMALHSDYEDCYLLWTHCPVWYSWLFFLFLCAGGILRMRVCSRRQSGANVRCGRGTQSKPTDDSAVNTEICTSQSYWQISRLHSCSILWRSVSFLVLLISRPAVCVLACCIAGWVHWVALKCDHVIMASSVFFSGMHIAPLEVSSTKRWQQSLQSHWFWAISIASFRERFFDIRSCCIVLNHVTWGRPSGLRQSSVGEDVKILLASALSVILAMCPNCNTLF